MNMQIVQRNFVLHAFRIWDLIVAVTDHCLSFYFSNLHFNCGTNFLNMFYICTFMYDTRMINKTFCYNLHFLICSVHDTASDFVIFTA